jgi:hypothetical protein
MNVSILALTGTLLRSPRELLHSSGGGPDRRTAAELIPALLVVVCLAAAIFGAVVGSYRGGTQYLFAAIKMPMLFALPLLVGLPAVWALHVACAGPLRYERVVVAALVGMSRAALLAAATAPALWLAYSLHVDYHLAILLMTAVLAAAGAIGMLTMLRCLPPLPPGRWLVHLVSLGVLGAVLAQSGWLLRPFVARPRADVSFLRPIESDVFSSLRASSRSARGRYEGWDAEAGGLLGEGGETR